MAEYRFAHPRASRACASRPSGGPGTGIVALNNAHAAELGLVDTGRLARMFEVAALATATGSSGDPDAFLLAFDERTPAQGPNHAWFLARHARFLYVDRVCVHARARRRGLARALYADLMATAARHGTPAFSVRAPG